MKTPPESLSRRFLGLPCVLYRSEFMSIEAVNYFNIFLGWGAIILQVLSFLVLVILFLANKRNTFLDLVNKYFLEIGFFITFFSTIFSLIYSEIIGYAPCYLCWYQRIAIYPLVILFTVALFQKSKRKNNSGPFKDTEVIKYAFPLVVLGFVFSAYQNFIYYFGDTSGPCDASGVSCYQKLVDLFGGYISIPMLALTGFVALAVLLLTAHFYEKRNLNG